RFAEAKTVTRTPILFISALISCAMLSSSVGFTAAGPMPSSSVSHADRNDADRRVPDKIAAKARPFDLTEVRLLEGPFRDAMLRDQQYLLSLDLDRLLHNFRVTAGLASSAKPLGGWEAPDVELRGHTVGHFLSACALMYSSTGDVRLKAKADKTVDELA